MSGPNRESDQSPESRVDDRALEEFLSGQGAVRAAWRAAKPADDAPPAALDAHILHMAAQEAPPAAAAARAVLQRGWSGAHGGWALAASLLLGSAVLLRLTESPEYLAQPAAQRPASAPSSVEARHEQAAAMKPSDAAADAAAVAVAPEGSAPSVDTAAPQAATSAPESTAVAAARAAGKAQARTSDARTASDQVSGRTQQQPAQADEAEPKRAEAPRNAPVVVPAAPPAALEMAVAAPEAFPAEDAAVRAPAPLARSATVLAPASAPPPPAAPPALAGAERIETPPLEPVPQAAPAFAPKRAAAASAKRRADRQEQAEAASHWPPDATQADGPSSTEVALAVERLLAAEHAGRGQAQAASAWVCAPAEFTLTQSTSERATVNVSAECYGLLTLAGPRAGWQMQPSRRQEQRSVQHLDNPGWQWEADPLPPQISPATALHWWQVQRTAMGLSPAQLELVREQLNRLPQ